MTRVNAITRISVDVDKETWLQMITPDQSNPIEVD